MQRCPGRDRLEAFLSDQLDPSARVELEDHLDLCTTCQGALDELTKLPDWGSACWTEAVPGSTPGPSAVVPRLPHAPPCPSDLVARGEDAAWVGDAGLSASRPAADRFRVPADVRVTIAADSSSTIAGSIGAGGDPVGRSVPAIPGYDILGELGRGGMGVVYRARQVRLDRSCALKMILAGAHATPESTARFLAEAQTLARIQHPNIIQIHHIGETDGLPFLELEYLPGGCLSHRLDGTPWPPRRAAGLVEQLAGAVAEAHRLGIVHRDLKPANVLLATDDTPRITDFGLAKMLDSESRLTRSDLILGSPAYMAPEQAEGRSREVGPAADVYALGAILYELLVGRPPFRGATVIETLDQVKGSEPVPPSRLVPRLPADLETICLKCLQKEPGRRYSDGAALAEDLRRFLEGRAIHARRVSAVERAARWCRRNKVVASLIGGIAVSLVLGAAFVAYFALQWRHSALEAGTRTIEAMQKTIEAEDLSARMAFERGLALAEQGQANQGLLWMAQAMRAAPAEKTAFRKMVRANLAAWESDTCRLRTLVEHKNGTAINAVAFRPDGAVCMTGGADHEARLWDVATGRPLGRPLLHDDQVRAVSFSPDGRLAVTGGDDRTARLWNAATGEAVGLPLQHPAAVCGAAFSLDGKLLITVVRDGPCGLWDAATGRPLDPGSGRLQNLLLSDFSPDFRAAITVASDRMVHIFDRDSGRPVGPRRPTDASSRARVISPDARLMLTAADDMARLWNTITGEAVGPPLVHQGLVNAVAFSPDGRLALTGGADHLARLWDVATGRPVGAPMEHRGPVSALAFTTDGRLILAGSEDGTARVWEVSPAIALAAVGPSSSRSGLGMLAPSRRVRFEAIDLAPVRMRGVVGGNDGVAWLYDLETGDALGVPMRQRWKRVRAVVLSPDGRRAAISSHDEHGKTTSGTVQIWDAATGRPASPQLPHANWVAAMAFSPDGRLLATGDYSGGVHLWDATTGARLGQTLRQQSGVWCLAFSPDGRTLAVGTFDPANVAQLWDVATGEARGAPLLGHSGWVVVIGFNGDGNTVLTASPDGTARLWDAATGRALGQPLQHQEAVSHATFSPDGRLVLTGSEDGTARLWDVATAQPAGWPLRHRSNVSSLAFSPDGRLALTGSKDGAARLWDVATSRPVGPPMILRGAVRGVTFRPDGRLAIALDEFGDMRAWNVPEPGTEDVDRLEQKWQARSGLEIDSYQEVVRLATQTWRVRQQSLGEDPAASAPAGASEWHDAPARDAEGLGDDFAADWHLERLITARPGDGLLHARRARLLARHGQHGRARDEVSEALRLGPRGRVLDWLTQCAAVDQAAGRFDDALRLLDRLVQERSDDWTLYAARADVYAGLGRSRDRASDLERAVALGADVAFLIRAADEHARAGAWERAAALYDRAIAAGPVPIEVWSQAALTHLRRGDRSGYQWVCAQLRARHPATEFDTRAIWPLANVCVLGPGGVGDDGQLLASVAELLDAVPPGADVRRRHSMLYTLALFLYRSGRVAEAIARLEEARAADPNPITDGERIIWALTQHALGREHIAEARRWLAEVKPPRHVGGPDRLWADLTLAVLRSEAEALIVYDPAFPVDPFAP